MSGLKRQINLLRGWPSPSLLPPNLLADEAQNILHHTSTGPSPDGQSPSLVYDDLSVRDQALLYGSDPGHLPLRKALGKWLAAFYGAATRETFPRRSDYEIPYRRIAITGGASQSLGVILTSVTDPSYTRNCWVVAPGYFMASKILEDAGFAGRLRAIPETSSGPDVQWLRGALKQREVEWAAEKAKQQQADLPLFKPRPQYPKTYKHVIYTVPTFANPSAVTTSTSTREDLVRCAREFDALVVCDDVYDMLQWPAQPSSTVDAGDSLKANWPRVVDVDRCLPAENPSDGFGNVVSNGSFSKVCGPGVRSGWLEASDKLTHLLSQAGTTKSGGAPSQMTSTILCGLLETGALTNHIANTLCPSYHRRWSAMMSTINEQLLPLGFTVVTGANAEMAGGYFVWLNLPEALQDQGPTIVKSCLEEQNLIIGGGRLFEIPGNHDVPFDSYIRLCIAWEAIPELMEGVRRLGEVCQNLIADTRGSHELPRLEDRSANTLLRSDADWFR